MDKRGNVRFSCIFACKKKGNILMGNIVFIVLNLVFLAILILFLLNSANNSSVLEQSYAKQIALLIDAADSGMVIELDMEKAKEIAEENGRNFEDVVIIEKNIITVQFDDEGYSYSFFNDVSVESFPSSKQEGLYVFTINDK